MASNSARNKFFYSRTDSFPTQSNVLDKIDEKAKNIISKDKSSGPFAVEFPEKAKLGPNTSYNYKNTIKLSPNLGRPLVQQPKQQISQTTVPDLNDDLYLMNHKYRGRVLIFSHKTFSDDQEARLGSEKDVANLKKQLPRLGFSVSHISVHEDFTFSEINRTLVKLSEEDRSNDDCLMVFVLTHGDINDKIYAKDTEYSVDKIWKHFLGDRCFGLSAKPKVFFIIACRGSHADAGVRIVRTRKLSTTTDGKDLSHQHNAYTIPIHADVLTVYSTTPGYYSYREEERGTWYIEAFCKEIERLKSKEEINFVDFLTKVNRKMSTTYSTFNPDEAKLNNKKQCASLTSTLLRKIVINIK